MTTFQRTTGIVAIVVSLGLAIYEARRASALESELRVLQGQNASLALQTPQQESKQEDGAHRADSHGDSPTAVTSELLRLRAEVGLLRRQLTAAEAKPQPATNQILFRHPALPRSEWSDHGSDTPQNTVLTMFWALRQGDESRLEQMLSRERGSRTLEDLTFRRDEWDRISAIQMVKTVVTCSPAVEIGTVEVIVEKAPTVDAADKDVDVHRWVLMKMKTNDHWQVMSTF